MKLDSGVTKIKSGRGRAVGYSANFRSVGTANEPEPVILRWQKGRKMSAFLFDNAEIISQYTRTQAIEDGLLVDMTLEPFGSLALEAGIKWAIAMTSTAFHEFVAVDEGAKGHAGQDLKGRWWDVVFMFRRTRREISPIEARWKLVVRDPDGRSRLKELKCVSGPADDISPCLTFMLPGED